ncbi:2-hydroxyacid dehydrogenase [Yoonia sp. R2331]|uniref:2-hydroxyacid dehydrogenase n=1 Tax=Yoonia sp. R2331 TaxID=3237238 RepID=UPI0034E3D68B
MSDLLLICPVTSVMMSRMEAAFTVHRWADLDTDWLAANGDRITHVMTDGHLGLKPAVMDTLPNLKMVSCYGVGYDAIDADAAAARGIMVTHTPDVLNQEVATTAILLLLGCYREVLRDDAYLRSGTWEKQGNAPLTRSVDNQTIGILGLGRIGQTIATKLAPWSPTILYHARSAKDVPYRYYDDLTAMAAACDALICITPGGAATEKLVNAQVIDALGPQGTLINVGRGSVVDETALIAALQSGRLGWAGLDVFEDEPRVPQALRDLPNTLLLPHVGSGTHETRAAMGGLAIDNLLQHQETGNVKTPVPECAGLA